MFFTWVSSHLQCTCIRPDLSISNLKPFFHQVLSKMEYKNTYLKRIFISIKIIQEATEMTAQSFPIVLPHFSLLLLFVNIGKQWKTKILFSKGATAKANFRLVSSVSIILIFLIKPFFCITKESRQKCQYLENKTGF